MTILHRVDEMQYTKKSVKTVVNVRREVEWVLVESPLKLERSRVAHERVGGKRHSRDAID
jgi:hypothetical protein